MSGFLWLPSDMFGGGREAEGRPLGAWSVPKEGLPCHRPFPLPAELSECQGKLQELHRLLQSLEALHRIPSAPVIPTHQVRAREEAGACPASPSCLPPSSPLLPWDRSSRHLVCGSSLESHTSPGRLSLHVSLPLGGAPSSSAHTSAMVSVFFLCHVSCLCPPPWPPASLLTSVLAAPCPHIESESPPSSTCQASVTTERPKKGKRTSRMWCTQSFAKDDSIGRVRRGCPPGRWGGVL